MMYFPVKMLSCKQVATSADQRGHHQRNVNIFFEFTFFLAFLDQLVYEIMVSFFQSMNKTGSRPPVIYHLLPGEYFMKTFLLHDSFNIIIDQGVNFLK